MGQNEFRDEYGLLDVCDVFAGEESQVVARRLLQRMERLGDGAWPQDRNPFLPSRRGPAPTSGQAEDAWMQELAAAWRGAADREIFDLMATAFGVRVNWQRVAAYLRAAGQGEEAGNEYHA